VVKKKKPAAAVQAQPPAQPPQPPRSSTPTRVTFGAGAGHLLSPASAALAEVTDPALLRQLALQAQGGVITLPPGAGGGLPTTIHVMHHHHHGPNGGGAVDPNPTGPLASDGVFEGVKGGGPNATAATGGQGSGLGPRVNVSVTLQQQLQQQQQAAGGTGDQPTCARPWTRMAGGVAAIVQLLAALGGTIALLVILQGA
jgi:hypothetical protein